MEPKLVRDLIPERIRADGFIPVTRIAREEEHLSLLCAKLCEEAKELQEHSNPEEFADVCEVIDSITAVLAHLYGKELLEAVRAHKKEERGGFETFTVLIEIRKPSSL